MSDQLKDFFVSIGFKVDDAERKRAIETAKSTQATLTQTTVEALAKRKAAEDKALADRINAIVSVNGELDAEEKAAAARFIKLQQETAEKAKRLDEEAQKKSRERREAGFKQAEAAILKFTGFALKVAVAVEGAALGIAVAVGEAAKSFDRLNFASKWTGASPRGINAFAFAISQLGGTVEGATSSLDAFGKKLTGPGGAAFEQMLNSLGIKTRDTAGKMRDSAAIATDALQAMGRMNQASSMAYATAFGFDDTTRRAGADPRLREFEAQREKDQAAVGFDPDKAAAEATPVAQSMRRLEAIAGDVGNKITSDLFAKVQPLLDKLSDWIAKHGAEIAKVAGDIADALVRLATAMGDAFSKVDWDGVFAKIDHFFSEFDKLTRKYFGKDGLTAVFEAFGAVIAANVTLKLLAMLDALQKLSGIPLFTRLLGLLGVGGAVTAAGAAAALLASTTSLDGNADRDPSGTPGSGGYYATPDGKYSLRRVWDGVKRAVGGARSRFGRAIGTGSYDDSDASGSDDPLKKFIARHEGAGYDVVYGHAERGGPLAPPKPITQMTIGEILAYQRSMKPRSGALAFPVGRAQWTESTLRSLTRDMDPNTVFTPEVQEKLFDRSIAGRMAQGPSGFQEEWDSLKGVDRAEIQRAIDGHRQAVAAAKAAAAAAPSTATQRLGSRLSLLPGATAGATPANPFGSLDMNHFKTTPLGPSVSSMYQSYDNSRTRGDTTIDARQTFTIQGSDVKANLSAAKLAAGRGTPDWIANLQGAEQ